MRLELNATPQEVMRAVEAVQAFGREKRLGEEEVFGLALAVEECASNIVNHAYRRDSRQKFQVTIEHTGNAFTIELRDHGPEFDPTLERIGPVRDDDSGPAGGWGIPLVRHYVDKIQYRREAGENVLRLTKRPGQKIPRPDSDLKTKEQ